MEKKTEKETQTAAEKWHLHQAQELIDSLVCVEEVDEGEAMSAEKMNELAQLIERVVPESCCGDDAVDRRNIARTVAFELERRAEDVCQHLVSAARRNEDVPPPWESQP